MIKRETKFCTARQEMARPDEIKVPEEMVIGAEQNVLTVINGVAGEFVGVGIAPAAKPGRALEETHAHTLRGEFYSGCESA